MTIQTKYNYNDIIYFIHNNRIVRYPVKQTMYLNGIISYSVLVSESQTLMDRDKYITIDEVNAFSSIDELCNFYKQSFSL